MWMQETGMSKEANIMTKNQMIMSPKEIWRKIRMFLEVSNVGGWCDQGVVVKHRSANLDFDLECVMVKGKLNAASCYNFQSFSPKRIIM
jgi:hypothetical protein